MVELVGQRIQRSAPGTANLDLADQVTGQCGSHVADRYPQEARSCLPRIIRGRQLSGDPGLQRLQQCGLSRRQHDRLPPAERLVDLFGGPLRLHRAGGSDLGHRGLYSLRHRRFQRACLLTAAQ